MSNETHTPYYVPEASYWPIVGSFGLLGLGLGAAGYLQGLAWGMPVLLLGAAVTVVMTVGWFADVIRERAAGLYSPQMARSFRWGMIWFIFSEVMFFAAFFGALFYVRVFAVPWLGGEDPATSRFLWDGVVLSWPTAGPGFLDLDFTPMAAWGLPAVNTLILLTSGVTLAVAHHAMRHGRQGRVLVFLAATIVLGALFLGIQIYEYGHAWRDLGLRPDTGIYGALFYMLTGFHGLHVWIGVIMLAVMLVRVWAGHFTAGRHFGFEAAAWYWHFVDVVWLGLFLFVYVL